MFDECTRRIAPLAAVLFVSGLALTCSCKPSTPNYGSNSAAGRTFNREGVQLYYEVYGRGEPLLLAHMNAGTIANFRAQIEHFRKTYKVIAMDSRDQGRSGDSPGKLTYEAMADDLAALLDHLQTGPANVLGWSDGGIEALLLGMRHPGKVTKIAVMGANLNPTEEAVRPEIIAFTKSQMDASPASARQTRQGRRDARVMQILFDEPHIDPAQLQTITAPTLVMAADHDLIRDEHTLEIYHRIPRSALCIFPNATHMVPYDNPQLFNAIVEHFFREPFLQRNRVKDFFKSFEAMQTAR